jgi:sugar phosphate isomerase/epimerase
MKLAASNLALPGFDHLHLLPRLRGFGIEGLEIAPHHTWADPRYGVTAKTVSDYRNAVEAAGLKVVGMHTLLPDRAGLGLFEDTAGRGRALDYLVHLSGVCRDLGGRTLILGPRWSQGLHLKATWREARTFLELLMPRIEDHGTVLCFAPLQPADGDFCATAHDCYLMATAIDHPAFGLHLGANALAANGEMRHQTFAALRGRLDHVHLDEPNLAAVGSTGRIDHADLRRHLAAISYFGWISMVQRTTFGSDSLEALGRSAEFITAHYLPLDTR